MRDMEAKRLYARESYAWYKAHRVCTKCHGTTAAPGITLCARCAEKVREKAREKTRTVGNRKRNYERYHRLKAQGICTVCGKHPAREGHVTCVTCGQYQKLYNREYYRRIKEKVSG